MHTDLDEQLLKLGAWVAALTIGYLPLVAAIQVLPLGERTSAIATRLLMSFLSLQLIRVGLKASHIGIAVGFAARDTLANHFAGWVKYRTRLKVGVACGSDVDRVVEILDQVAHQSAGVCRDTAPRVRMRGFGDSSLDFEVLCWVDHPSERGLVTHELFMAIYKALARAGIEIPFPQRDVRVRAVPEPAAAAAHLDPPGGRASAQP